jgi:hypothetical protein
MREIFPQEKQARDPILCTLTSLGTCIKNDKEQDRSDTTDPEYI